MSSAPKAKGKPSGIPVPSSPTTTSPTTTSPTTTSPTQRRRSSGGSTNSKGARVKFEDDQKKSEANAEQKPEAKGEPKPEVEETLSQSAAQAPEDDSKNTPNEPQPEPIASTTSDEDTQAPKPFISPIFHLPRIVEVDDDDDDDGNDYQPFNPQGDDLYDENPQDTYQFQDNGDEEDGEDYGIDSPQDDPYSFTTPPTSPDVPPGNPPMVTTTSTTTASSPNYDNEASSPLPSYLLFNGTLILLATLLYALLKSYPVTSFVTLLFPAVHLLLSGIVLSLVSSQTSIADPVTAGWKAVVQVGTMLQWLYFVLEVYKDFFGYNAGGGFLPGGYGLDVGLGDFGPIDLGPLSAPRWPHAAKVMMTRGEGLRREGTVLETVDKLVSIAAGVGVAITWFVVAMTLVKLRSIGGQKRKRS
ncbi:hypothetical protein QBC40DRAFT_328593 [Triangularia verruculosa]|uniref:Uncharacterized protein n=1 Tax=Triangularia verruculosa TaxID=2587418 RepID=A0AAN7ASG8_9PEZI|nr:hypothetical protein QBC40DRAFT_328593 [Triangularia verruculosa]